MYTLIACFMDKVDNIMKYTYVKTITFKDFISYFCIQVTAT